MNFERTADMAYGWFISIAVWALPAYLILARL